MIKNVISATVFKSSEAVQKYKMLVVKKNELINQLAFVTTISMFYLSLLDKAVQLIYFTFYYPDPKVHATWFTGKLGDDAIGEYFINRGYFVWIERNS